MKGYKKNRVKNMSIKKKKKKERRKQKDWKANLFPMTQSPLHIFAHILLKDPTT